MGVTHSSESARNRQKDFGRILDKRGLLFRSEHQIAVALLLRGERREYSATDPEIGRAHVRAFLGAFQAQGNPSKVCDFHRLEFSHVGRTSRSAKSNPEDSASE